MKDFKELKVWQKAYALSLVIYEKSRSFPREELYGLTGQLRRAAVSVGANIAEGCGRRSDREFIRFLQIARGSLSELEHHLMLARDLKFITHESHQELDKKIEEVQRMLTSLVSAIGREGEPRASKTKVTKTALGASGQ